MIKKILVYIFMFSLLTVFTIHTVGQPVQTVLSSGPALVENDDPDSPTSEDALASPSLEAIESASPDDDTSAPSFEPMPTPTVLSEPLDQIFTDYEADAFSGSVLIEKDGEVILYKGYGMADTEGGVNNTPDTKFLIGSVTKQFTAMAIMQLYEKGLLDIRDKLSAYIPDFPQGADIELTNLLTMTSGIVDYMNDSPPLVDEMPSDELSMENIIEKIMTMPLKFEPGSKYSYCNTNYLILSYIVENVSGLSYADYLSQNIFEILGMENTGVYDIDNPPENMAKGNWSADKPVCYYTQSGEIDPESANATIAGYGAGSLYSTVADLYLWDQAISTEKLLSKEYMELIFTQTVLVPGAIIPSDYGFGWIIQSDADFGTIWEHTGALGGFRAFNGIFIEEDIKVIILYNNMTFTDRDKLLPAVKQALLEA